MYYKPSKKRHLRKAISVFLCLSLIMGSPLSWSSASDDLPDFGGISGTMLTPAEEKRLGKAFMRQIRATQPVIEDPLLEDYLKDLGDSLVEHSDGVGSSFTFFFIDSPQINAFAGPGGYIGIYTGLMLTTDSESELAAVVAHEITHVTQKHLLRAWHAASSMTMVQGAALVAAVILGAAIGGEAAIAASAGAQAAMMQNQINFTRSNEKEADRIGIGILHEADFDAHAMPSFFGRMGRANRTYGSAMPEYLRTHPVSTSRIADSLGRAEQYPYRQHADSLRYFLARAAIRERSFINPDESILFFEKALLDGRFRNEIAVRYGYTVALTRNEQFARAAEEAEKLLETHPDTLEFLILRARIDAESGKLDKAVSRLEKAATLYPVSYPLRITLAEIYLRAGMADKAYQDLEQIALFRKDNTRVYKLLAQAAAARGKKAESHEYMATHYYLSGALNSAVLQLEIALRDRSLPYYDAARLESRLQAVKKEVEELEEQRKK